MKIQKSVIDLYKRGVFVMSPEGQLAHRALIIQRVCDLESDLCDIIAKFLVTRNPSVTREKIIEDLYRENGMLGSLNRISKMAFYLGFITHETNHDLQKLSKIRNRYAHDRDKKQLEKEPELFKLLKENYIYNKNNNDLKDMAPQEVFILIHIALSDFIKSIKI